MTSRGQSELTSRMTALHGRHRQVRRKFLAHELVQARKKAREAFWMSKLSVTALMRRKDSAAGPSVCIPLGGLNLLRPMP